MALQLGGDVVGAQRGLALARAQAHDGGRRVEPWWRTWDATAYESDGNAASSMTMRKRSGVGR